MDASKHFDFNNIEHLFKRRLKPKNHFEEARQGRSRV